MPKNRLAIATMLAAFSAVSTACAGSVTVPDRLETTVSQTQAAPIVHVSAATTAQILDRIQPHRAYYEMSMSKVHQSSSVSDVRGLLGFQWADACDGWTVEQLFRIQIFNSEGGEVDMQWSYATWESKDGLDYRFSLRRSQGGDIVEEVRGSASLNEQGGAGAAEFTLPEEETIDLPPGTVFPTAHTIKILEAIKAGRSFFSMNLFDGSELGPASEISTLISDLKPGLSVDGVEDPLVSEPFWPVRLAFFPAEISTETPEHEQSLQLTDRGIVREIALDYDDFSLKGELTDFEVLAPDC